jgi:pimeloyl-ACP methyl ester carboxylesterase
VEEKFWEWEGHRIRYTEAGDEGPAMILVHGFGGNADHWRKNAPVLGKHGRVFAIDLLGYGYSSKPDPMKLEQNAIYNFENWSRQLRAFIKDVVGEPAFLMCNSVGGVAGLQAAVDDKELVRGVCLLNISLRGLHVTKQPAFAKPFIKALQTTLRTTDIGKKFFGNVARAETVKNVLREAYADSNAVTDELVECILKPGLQPGAAEVFLDFISYSGGPLPEDLLPKVAETTPVRILWGRDDPWEIVTEGRKYGEYACVDRFIELPGVGHCPMDEAPDLVNPLLVEFVNDYREVTAGAE